MPTELPIPAAVLMDAKSVELLRVWAAGGAQHVSMATEVWDDPAAWGLVLVDLARHVARAYNQSRGDAVDGTLERIREGFDAEWGDPTDTPGGSLTS